MILFISWNFLQYVDLPFTEISHSYQDVPFVEPTGQTETDLILSDIRTSLAVYIIAILSFVGWFFVVFFHFRICCYSIDYYQLCADFCNQ